MLVSVKLWGRFQLSPSCLRWSRHEGGGAVLFNLSLLLLVIISSRCACSVDGNDCFACISPSLLITCYSNVNYIELETAIYAVVPGEMKYSFCFAFLLHRDYI